MENIQEKNIGEMVAADYRLAQIFQKYNIDFCCNGNKKLSEACANKNIPAGEVEKEIIAVTLSPSEGSDKSHDYQSWSLDLLADYIEKKHHRFVTEQIPVLQAYLDRICAVHGRQHPELIGIRNLFQDSAAELTMHMKKEELMLFPYIRKMANSAKGEAPRAPFGTVENPIMMMMHEHDAEGDRFHKIRMLSSDYTVPPEACNTYRVTFASLLAFEKDLHIHIHLENNILFPKAIEMEQKLSANA